MFERSRKGETALLIQPHAGGPPDEGITPQFLWLHTSKRPEPQGIAEEK